MAGVAVLGTAVSTGVLAVVGEAVADGVALPVGALVTVAVGVVVAVAVAVAVGVVVGVGCNSVKVMRSSMSARSSSGVVGLSGPNSSTRSVSGPE